MPKVFQTQFYPVGPYPLPQYTATTTITITVSDSNGTSTIASTTATTQYKGILATPTGLTGVDGTTNGTVVLTWNDVPHATGYTIFENGNQIGTATSTTFTVTGVTNGSYTFGVEATAQMWETGPLLVIPFNYPGLTPPAVPAVNSATFNIAIIATVGENVGTMTATNNPTSWSIILGDPSGNFAINNAGKITVTANGVANLTATGTQVLTVQATNLVGSGTGLATVNYTLQVPSVQNASFSFNLPVTSGFNVGTMTATNNPTSWALLGGDPLGDFQINSSTGVITTTKTINSSVNETLTIQATNAAGSSTGTAMITNSASLVRSNVTHITGQYYFEMTVNVAANIGAVGVGVDNGSESLNTCAGGAGGICWIGTGGVNYNSGGQYTAASYAVNNVLGIAVDLTHEQIWFRNGAGNWNNSVSANPATNTGGFSIAAISGNVFAVAQLTTTADEITANFAGPFANAAPAGFGLW